MNELAIVLEISRPGQWRIRQAAWRSASQDVRG
jgi:hypothetical protein